MEDPPPGENYRTIRDDSVMDGHGVASLISLPRRATCYLEHIGLNLLSVYADLISPHVRRKVRNSFCGPKISSGEKVCVGVSNVGVMECFPNVAQLLIGSPLNEKGLFFHSTCSWAIGRFTWQ